MILQRRTKYLQIALNGSLDDAKQVINDLPQSENILIEAGTPLIKELGTEAIAEIRSLTKPNAYLVADIKCADLADREVQIVSESHAIPGSSFIPAATNASFFDALKMTAQQLEAIQNRSRAGIPFGKTAAGASAATVLGVAPVETIDLFIEECRKHKIDSMVDMMNVENPLFVLKKLKTLPDVVILHRGVDETEFSREKQIPYYQIKQIKGNFNVLVSVAGGDTIREVQSAFFNDADIVVVWKNFYQANQDTARLAADFLKEVK
jgi:bifunctional enzyme Fae/Hps